MNGKHVILVAATGMVGGIALRECLSSQDGIAVRHAVAKAGITVLVNDAVPDERTGERIWLAGRGDPAGISWHRGGGLNAAPDIECTLSGIPPSELTVAFAHNPALWPDLAQRGVYLTLSGHTHYGQLAIPDWG
jgi:predicted MPP superfamily phosphohydrolase